MTKRFLVLMVLAGLVVPALGCGSGDDGSLTGEARSGPQVFVLPFLPAAAGQNSFVGLKNLFVGPATVFLSAYAPGGAAYNLDGDTTAAGVQPVRLVVPARGELRVPLPTITGAGTLGGWLHVDTRNVDAPDPASGEPVATASSGFVFPYLHREIAAGNIEVESTPGYTGQSSGVRVALTPLTDTLQLVNYSYTQAPGGVVPLPVTYTVNTFDVAGTMTGSLPIAVPANGSVSFAPAVTVGSVRIEPVLPGPPPAGQRIRYGVSARENGHQVHFEHRQRETSLAHLPGQLELGFEVEFGQDAAGNLHDFEVLLSNSTASDQTLLLRAIYLDGGAPLLTTPRAFLLGAGRTVLMRTETADSLGLAAGEVSLLNDLFGDVFVNLGHRSATLFFQAPLALDISVRHLDPSFASFYGVLRVAPRTNNACVSDLPILTTTATGVRNSVSITNPTNSQVTVPMRGYTPGGTEYVLDPIVVGPLARIEWSPDGQTFREDPTDLLAPAVTFMRFQFFPPTGLCFRPRTVRTAPGGLIEYIAPAIVRDN